MEKVLLHTCCAPCSTHPLEELKNKGFEVILFYYNPNIHPREEYEMRVEEAKKYSKNKVEIIEGNYDVEKWFELTKGLEEEPERGKRCEICFETRMRATAEKAKELKFDYFTTTLSISPHKDAKLLNKIGAQLEQELGVKYLEANWKKCDGFLHSLEMSREAKLRRQNYCGCVYSRRDSRQN